ncbi:phasin family protein [Roseivivax sp. CAU 1753]
MANTSKTQDTVASAAADEFNTLVHLQEAGLGNLMGMSSAWIETITDMGAEVAAFVAERIQEDVKTQHAIMHCRNVAEMQHVQAEFIQKALEQYQAETGKLLRMGTRHVAKPPTGDTD